MAYPWHIEIQFGSSRIYGEQQWEKGKIKWRESLSQHITFSKTAAVEASAISEAIKFDLERIQNCAYKKTNAQNLERKDDTNYSSGKLAQIFPN